MKLLIIAGPYEADRLRKAAVSAGFETVAVEPGESLSGWITASRPELIVMAPQIVHPDPALALAKVRSVPRGRVPIFLVGDTADRAKMRSLADGFFVRPVAADLLFERARAVLDRAGTGRHRLGDPQERTDMGLGPSGTPSAPDGAVGGSATAEPSGPRRTSGSGASGAPGQRAGGTLKPLVAASSPAAGSVPKSPDPGALLAALDANIDALFDAELDAALGTSPAGESARSSAETVNPDEVELFAEDPTTDVRPARVMETTPPPADDSTRARLLARYAPVENGDYFAVLGVSAQASVEDVRQAYQQIVDEIAPESLGPELARELAPQIGAIREVTAEALRVLSDAELGPRYASRMPK